MIWQLMWRNVRAVVLNTTLRLLVIYRCSKLTLTQKIEKPLRMRVSAYSEASRW